MIGRKMLRQHAIETDWTLKSVDISSADSVLEIGFGAGRGLSLALERADRGKIVGMDISAAMLRAARRLNEVGMDSGRLHLVGGNLAALPFAGESFDKIFSIHTLYFWPQPDTVLQEILGLLVPGGRAVITFASAKQLPSGEWADLDVKVIGERLVTTLFSEERVSARLELGPEARGFQNAGLVIDRNPITQRTEA